MSEDDRSASQARRRQGPSRKLPLFYFGYAHLCLLTAFAAIAWDPAAFAGFFYHPRLLAAVHLVTLGWITSSILGALYLIGPMALRTPMSVRPVDHWMFVAYFLGSSGVVSHFWIEELSGVGLSGLVLAPVFIHIGWKTLAGLRRAPIPLYVKLHFTLAFANLAGAVIAGTLFGFNRWQTFLPGASLDHAYAHAHLAALGWVAMMIFGAGYRLLPMFLPAAMPAGRGPLGGVLIFEFGVLGMFVSFLGGGRWLGLFAITTVVGIAFFFFHLGWMLRHRRPPPKARKLPDFGVLQVFVALLYLFLGCVFGLELAFSDTTDLRAIWIYGICGLIGFLSQMVVGISHRLIPLFAWLTSYTDSDWQHLPPSPHDLPDRRWQAFTTIAWALGVPALAVGFAWDHPTLLRLGAAMLSLAALASGISQISILRSSKPQITDLSEL